MPAITHVLVPTDGSEGARKAAVLAGEIARAFDARVTVIMVQSEDVVISSAWGLGGYPAGAAAGTMPVEQIRETIEEGIRAKEIPDTEKALGQLAEPARSAMVWGHPADQICAYASENGVDLIVMGSHGRSGLKRALLGSVSHAVTHQAPCPVTIVR